MTLEPICAPLFEEIFIVDGSLKYATPRIVKTIMFIINDAPIFITNVKIKLDNERITASLLGLYSANAPGYGLVCFFAW